MPCKRKRSRKKINQEITASLRLVSKAAFDMNLKTHSSIRYDDLYASGLFGFMQAAQRWDPKFGVKLETYAWPRIVGQMVDDARATFWGKRAGDGPMTNISALEQTFPDGRAVMTPKEASVHDTFKGSVLAMDCIQYSLAYISPRSRIAVILYYFQHMIYKDIGKVLGVCEARAYGITKRALEDMGSAIRREEYG